MNPFSASLAFPPLRRDAYSVSPTPATPFPFGRSNSVSGGDDDDEDEDGSLTGSDDGDDDYSDVDFWGGESPRTMSRSPPSQRVPNNPLNDAADVESEEESEGYEDDEEMLDNDDDDDETEGDELSRMEIFGHR